MSTIRITPQDVYFEAARENVLDCKKHCRLAIAFARSAIGWMWLAWKARDVETLVQMGAMPAPPPEAEARFAAAVHRVAKERLRNALEQAGKQ